MSKEAYTSAASSEVEQLREQNDALTRELVEVTESNLSIINGLILCQGVLATFSFEEVRQGFIEGKFNVPNHSLCVLRSLDALRQILLPVPSLARGGVAAGSEAAAVVMKLLSQDKGEPVDRAGCPLPFRQSYGMWRTYLHSMMTSNLWADLKLDSLHSTSSNVSISRKGDNLQVDSEGNVNCASGFRRNRDGVVDGVAFGVNPGAVSDVSGVQHERDRSSRLEVAHPHKRGACAREADFVGFSPVNMPKVVSKSKLTPSTSPGGWFNPPDTGRTKTVVKTKHASKRQEAAAVQNSDSSTSHESSSDSDDSYSDSDCSRNRRHKSNAGRARRLNDNSGLTDALRYLKFSREVVPPCVFDVESDTPFKRFLSTYERYFDSKFEGTDRDRSLQLGLFLQGSVKRAYDAMGGGQIKYCKLKQRLLEWYSGERCSARQKSLAELQNATMLPGDSLCIYTMRLEKLARKAFPDSQSECERHLQRKFRQTVPASVIDKLDNAQSALSIFGEKKLSWNRIKKLAEAEDRLLRQRNEDGLIGRERPWDAQASVWYSRSRDEGVRAQQSGRQDNCNRLAEPIEARPRTPYVRGAVFRGNRGYSGSSDNPGRRIPPMCAWCGRQGHMEYGCWMKQGACMICGAVDHQRDQCPRGNAWDQTDQVKLTCSKCWGSHLGKDCPMVDVDPHTPLNSQALN